MVTLAALALSVGVLLGAARPGLAAAASNGPSATLRVDPATSTVDGGATFAINVVQNASVETIGAQANLAFDPKLVHVTDVKPGELYTKGLFLFGSSDDGTNKSLPAAIAKANLTGILQNVATFLVPGSGTVPPGDAVVVTITMKAEHGPGGTTPLNLNIPQISDPNGNLFTAFATGGSVTVGASAAASDDVPSAAAPPSAPPSANGGGPAGSAASAMVAVVPAGTQVAIGAIVRVDLKVAAGRDVSGVTANLGFDRTVLQVTKVELGSAWGGATLLGGATGGTVDSAIAQANTSGVLTNVGVLVPSPSLPGGGGVFLSVTMKGLVDGTSPLKLTGVSVLGADGSNETATVQSSQLVVGSGGGGVPLLPIAAAAAVVAGLVALLLARSRRRSRS